MKITLEEYGGFAAGIRRLPKTIELEALPTEAAEELSRLVAAAQAGPPMKEGPGHVRDAMAYTITVEESGKQSILEGADGNMSPTFAALLNFLRRQPGNK